MPNDKQKELLEELLRRRADGDGRAARLLDELIRKKRAGQPQAQAPEAPVSPLPSYQPKPPLEWSGVSGEPPGTPQPKMTWPELEKLREPEYIGLAEARAHEVWQDIPFGGESAKNKVAQAMQWSQDTLAATKMGRTTTFPVDENIGDMAFPMALSEVKKHLTYGTPDTLARKTVDWYEKRSRSPWYVDVFRGVGGSVKMMGEFLALAPVTGPLGKLVGGTVAKAVPGLTGKILGGSATIIAETIPLLATHSPTIVSEYKRRIQAGESAMGAAYRAIMDEGLQLGVERLGGYLTGPLSRVGALPILSKIKNVPLLGKVTKIIGGVLNSKISTKAGLSGLAPEKLEEEITRALQLGLDTQEWETIKKEYTVREQLLELAVLGILTGPVSMARAMGQQIPLPAPKGPQVAGPQAPVGPPPRPTTVSELEREIDAPRADVMQAVHAEAQIAEPTPPVAPEVAEPSPGSVAAKERFQRSAAHDYIQEMLKQKSALKKGLITWQELQRGDYDKETLTASALNRLVLGAKQQASKLGYRVGQKELNAEMTRLAGIAKETLPDGEWKMLARVMARVVKARTPASKRNLIVAMEHIVENHKRMVAERRLRTGLKNLAKRAPEMRPRFRAKAESLLSGISATKPQEATVEKYLRVLKALKTDEMGAIPVQLARKAESILESSKKKQIRDLPAEDIDLLTKAIIGLQSENRKTEEYILRGMLRDAKLIEKQVAFEISKLGREKYKPVPGELVKKRFRTKAARLLLGIFKGQELDYYTLTGKDSLAYKIGYTDMIEGQRIDSRVRREANEAILQAFAAQGITPAEFGQWFKKDTKIPLTDTIDEDGKRVTELKTSRLQRMALASFYFDPKNKAEANRHKQKGVHLIGHRRAYKFSQADWRAIIKSLTPEERSVIDAAFEHISGPLWDATNETYRRLRLHDLGHEKIHWPRIRRKKRGQKLRPLKYAREITLDDLGVLKERSASNEPFIIGDFLSEYAALVSKSAAYAGKEIPAQNSSMLVKSDAFYKAMDINHPNPGRFIKDQLEVIEEYRAMSTPKSTDLDKSVKWMIKNIHTSLLGLQPQIIGYQTVSLIHLGRVIPAKYVRQAMKKLDHSDTRALIDKLSPPLWDRINSDAHGIITPNVGTNIPAETLLKKKLVDKIAMGPIHWADTQVVYRAVDAAQFWAKDMGWTQEEGMRKAEYAFDTTQPSWNPLITPKIMRYAKNNPLLRAALMFSSQRAQLFQMSLRSVAKYKQGKQSAGDFATMVKELAITNVGNAILLALMAEGTDFIYGLATGDDSKDFNLFDVAWNALYRFFGGWLLVGDAPAEYARVKRMVQGRRSTYGVDVRSGVLGGAYENTIMTLVELEDYLMQEARTVGGTKKKRQKLLKLIDRAVNAQGTFTGVPARGLWRPVKSLLKKKRRGARALPFLSE